MELVDGLVLVRPLKVELDLPDQREAVGVGDVQLLHLIDPILLKTIITNK